MCWSVHEARHLAKKAADNEGRHADGQPGPLAGRSAARPGIPDGRRDRRRHAKCTSGRIARSRSGRRACRGRRRCRPTRAAALEQHRRHAPARGRDDRRATRCPTRSSWDLFLGVAPDVEYHPLYHPFNWRGWVDWGQGALGDMGAHLDRSPGVGPEARPADGRSRPTSTPFNGVCYPNATTTYYEFPARKGMPAVKLVWYDGGLTPPRPEELGEERLNGEGGILYVGSKGKMLQKTYGAAAAAAAVRAAQLLRRAEGKAGARSAPVARDELGERDQGHATRSRARSPTRRT